MKIVNLTPHTIVVAAGEGRIAIQPSGIIARVTSKMTPIGNINGFEVRRCEFGSVENLPDPQPDTVFVVSALVLQALAGKRQDVVAPDTSPTGAIRDNDGRIVAVTGFQIL